MHMHDRRTVEGQRLGYPRLDRIGGVGGIDRERRRAAMAADPAWATYLKKVADTGALVKMQNRIVKPTAFFEAFQAAQKG